MSIPRRPVASPPPVADQPSPIGSISSLLSAYSRSSGESILRSSEGTTSTKTSYMGASPDHLGLGSELKRLDDLAPLSPFTIDADMSRSPRRPEPPRGIQDRPPPPPSKQEARPQVPSKSPVDTTPTLANSPSAPQPQIWRRRSLKSEKTPAVSELRLAATNGSTAATQSPAESARPFLQPAQPPTNSTSPLQTARTPTGLTGLPGRNIRPAAPQDWAGTAPKLGDRISQIEAKLDIKLGTVEKQAEPQQTVRQQTAKPDPPIQRLPTPEYEKHDVRRPLVQTIVSPVSPASSPELPSRQSSQDSQSKPIQRKALAGRDIRPVKSTPLLKAEPATAADSTTPEVPSFLRQPQRPKDDSAVGRDIISSQLQAPPEAQPQPQPPAPAQHQFPARTTSRLREQPKVVLRRPPAEPATESEPVPRPSREPAAETAPAGRDWQPAPARETPRLSVDTSDAAIGGPETQSGETSPSSQAPIFPVSFANPAPPGTVFAAPPLATKNFMCMQRHRAMYRDNNIHCPLSCQTCHKQDTEIRWKCKWCYLRVCNKCMSYLSENDRDLERLLDYLEHSIPEEEDPVDDVAATDDGASDEGLPRATRVHPSEAGPPPASLAVAQEA